MVEWGSIAQSGEKVEVEDVSSRITRFLFQFPTSRNNSTPRPSPHTLARPTAAFSTLGTAHVCIERTSASACVPCVPGARFSAILSVAIHCSRYPVLGFCKLKVETRKAYYKNYKQSFNEATLRSSAPSSSPSKAPELSYRPRIMVPLVSVVWPRTPPIDPELFSAWSSGHKPPLPRLRAKATRMPAVSAEERRWRLTGQSRYGGCSGDLAGYGAGCGASVI